MTGVCVCHVVAVALVKRQNSLRMLSRAHVTTTVRVAAGKSRQSEISSLKGHKTSPFRFVSFHLLIETQSKGCFRSWLK